MGKIVVIHVRDILKFCFLKSLIPHRDKWFCACLGSDLSWSCDTPCLCCGMFGLLSNHPFSFTLLAALCGASMLQNLRFSSPRFHIVSSIYSDCFGSCFLCATPPRLWIAEGMYYATGVTFFLCFIYFVPFSLSSHFLAFCVQVYLYVLTYGGTGSPKQSLSLNECIHLTVLTRYP